MGNQTVKFYASDGITVTLGTEDITNGLPKDGFIEITPESPLTKDDAGCDGEVSISRTNDQRQTIMLKLKATSDHNDYLSVLANLMKNAPGGAGAVQPFRVFDGNGRSVFFAPNTWVQDEPPISYAEEVQTNEWGLRCAHMAKSIAGN